MVTIKIILTTLFFTLVAGYEPIPNPMGSPFVDFINRLGQYLEFFPSHLSFTLSTYVLQELPLTTYEFQDLCLRYESESRNEPAAALNDAIDFVFYDYHKRCLKRNVRGDVGILEEIEKCDPVGFNAYLRKMHVGEKDKSRFSNCIATFYKTMQVRIRLLTLRYDNSIDIPEYIRDKIATEYGGLGPSSINYFINIAARQFGRQMYPIDLVEMDKFAVYTKKKDDIQLFSATYYAFGSPQLMDLHALCINYKQSTGKVHVYDSNGDSIILEGRQAGIIDKMYPNREIIFEKSTALQSNSSTCATFAITYATYLLCGKDPAVDQIKFNDVQGDETLYMRLHIIDMFSKKKVFLPNY